VIALLEDQAYNGAPSRNPFFFRNCHLEEFNLMIEGTPFPAVPYKMNFDHGTTHGNTANARVLREFYDNSPIGNAGRREEVL
jgi:hypothetical protein